jgi:hypothetical protein
MFARRSQTMMQPVSSDSIVKPASLAGGLWNSVWRSKQKLSVEFPEGSERELDKVRFPPELHDLIDAIEVVRRRTLTNAFLGNWLVWLGWILVGLIVAAAFSRRLAPPLIWAATFLGVGALVAAVRAWWTKPSPYFLAYKLDSASGLYDRLSTALYFGTVQNPDLMTLRQRRDAADRLKRLDPSALFPIHMPAFASRTLVLAVIAAGLFAYRVHYSPPILALVRKAAGSNVQKAVFSPLTAMKKELLSLVNRDSTDVQQAAADAEAVPGLADAKNADAQSLDDKNGMAPDGDLDGDSDSENPGQPGEPGDPQQGDAGSQGQGQDASQAADAPQQQQQQSDPNQPQSASENGERGTGEQQSADGQQSASNSVLQALKNLVKNMAGQQSNSAGESGGQPSSAGSSQQGGNSPGQGAKSDSQKDASDQKDSSSSSGSQKPGGGAGNGSMPVPKQPAKAAPLRAGNMVPDRVDLDSNNFRQQGRIRTTAAPGEAQVPMRDIKPQPTAAIKGAEQENIPERYRLYVQRYFERTDSKQSQ